MINFHFLSLSLNFKIPTLRCYNCGEFANHVAAKCSQGPQPKKCHQCKAVEHLIAECPLREEGKKSGKKNHKSRKIQSSAGSTGQGSDLGSEEDSCLQATETGSSSSEKHLSDSGITRSSNGKSSTNDDTKSEGSD